MIVYRVRFVAISPPLVYRCTFSTFRTLFAIAVWFRLQLVTSLVLIWFRFTGSPLSPTTYAAAGVAAPVTNVLVLRTAALVYTRLPRSRCGVQSRHHLYLYREHFERSLRFTCGCARTVPRFTGYFGRLGDFALRTTLPVVPGIGTFLRDLGSFTFWQSTVWFVFALFLEHFSILRFYTLLCNSFACGTFYLNMTAFTHSTVAGLTWTVWFCWFVPARAAALRTPLPGSAASTPIFSLLLCVRGLYAPARCCAVYAGLRGIGWYCSPFCTGYAFVAGLGLVLRVASPPYTGSCHHFYAVCTRH